MNVDAIRAALDRFEYVQHLYADCGAEDSGPDALFQGLLTRPASGRPVTVPADPRDWSLCRPSAAERPCSHAAAALHEAAAAAVAAIQAVPPGQSPPPRPNPGPCAHSSRATAGAAPSRRAGSDTGVKSCRSKSNIYALAEFPPS